MEQVHNGSVSVEAGPKKEVVILLSDMVQYSQRTSSMRPEEIRDFMIEYHENIWKIICGENGASPDIEPLAGDGALIIFEKGHGEGRAEICTRAVNAAVRMATESPWRDLSGLSAEGKQEEKTRFHGLGARRRFLPRRSLSW